MIHCQFVRQLPDNINKKIMKWLGQGDMYVQVESLMYCQYELCQTRQCHAQYVVNRKYGAIYRR